jgi:hypothetical protein
MGKEIKLSKEESRDRKSMIGKILPKRDFEKVIEHDKIYANSISQYLEFLLIKQDILSKKCESVLNPDTQTREGIIKNIDALCEFGKTRLECLDLKAHLIIQNKLVSDKTSHHKEIFLPQYNIEIEEMKKGFDEYFTKANTLVNEKKTLPIHQEIKRKVELELLWFNDIKEKDMNDEYKLMVFKPLRRLMNALDNIDKNKSE